MLPNTEKAVMHADPKPAPKPLLERRFLRLLIITVGIVLGQVVLYGPSLAGWKILLPLDILAQPGIYLPRTPEVTKIQPQNECLADLVFQIEPARRFAVSEIHAGRLPMWAPYHYAGVPCTCPKFSPLLALQFCTESPVVLAWTQLLAALVAGVGAYSFCRRVLAVSFWPAVTAAWCYPLTGPFVFWQGYPICPPVVWLPWLLFAVDRTVRRACGWAPIGLAVVSCLVLISGQLDVAAQVLLGSGLYALWCLWDAHPRPWLQRPARRAVLSLTLGWGLGFLLAAPYSLPVLEYARTSARIAARAGGHEEHPPIGLSALPQVVLPDMYGAEQAGSVRLEGGVQIESTAAAYTGVVATLLVAPLAWCSRRHRSFNVLWLLLALFSLSWSLNLPGFVNLLRLPGLKMLPHNRLVFLTSFAFLAMTAVGLEVLRHRPIALSRWFWLPAALSATLLVWCLYRVFFLPEDVATKLGLIITQLGSYDWVHDMDGVLQVQGWFVRHYAAAALLSGLALGGWLCLRFRPAAPAWLLPLAGVLLVVDLLWFAHGRSAQCDPALYYPRVPVLEEVRNSTLGRIFGHDCLPASLAMMCGLRDIRGYDAVDPARFIDLMAIACHPASAPATFALTAGLTPITKPTRDGGIQLSPVLDMLDVRYIVFRGSPPQDARPSFQGPDYWVLVNSNALPRAYAPRRVEVIKDAAARLEKLASPAFDPREVAYVEAPVNLSAPCQGTAEILDEVPTRIKISLRMETAGLLVLADLWDAGWRGYLNGKLVPILRTNHAIRGVVVPEGAGMLEFRYEPASFTWGLRLAVLSATLLVGWSGIVCLRRRKNVE